MSEENVELIRRIYEEFDRTRRGSIEERQRAVLSAADPEVEWHTATDLPDSRVYRGHDGVAALIQEWVNSFEGFRVDAEEFIDRGEYVVVPWCSVGEFGDPGNPSKRSPSRTPMCTRCARARSSRRAST